MIPSCVYPICLVNQTYSIADARCRCICIIIMLDVIVNLCTCEPLVFVLKPSTRLG
jgi:hypothetical protein